MQPPSGPPLAAIDRFLYGHNNNNGHQLLHSCDDVDVIGGFPPDQSYCGGEWRRVEEEEEEEEIMYSWGRSGANCNYELMMENEGKIISKGKKFKKGSSANLIKGQWTEEEDR